MNIEETIEFMREQIANGIYDLRSEELYNYLVNDCITTATTTTTVTTNTNNTVTWCDRAYSNDKDLVDSLLDKEKNKDKEVRYKWEDVL